MDQYILNELNEDPTLSAKINQYQQNSILWICSMLALCTSFFIGANDLGNSMATVYGSRALNLNQAAIIGAIFQAIGAMTLGLRVSTTLDTWVISPQSKIVDHQFAVAMLSILSITLAILCIASVAGVPISCTQLTVGCFLGAILFVDGVQFEWSKFLMLILFWVVTPFLSFGLSCLFYCFIKKKITLKQNPQEQSIKFFPFFISFSFGVTFLFILLEIFQRYWRRDKEQVSSQDYVFYNINIFSYLAIIISISVFIFTYLLSRLGILLRKNNANHKRKFNALCKAIKIWEVQCLCQKQKGWYNEQEKYFDQNHYISSLQLQKEEEDLRDFSMQTVDYKGSFSQNFQSSKKRGQNSNPYSQNLVSDDQDQKQQNLQSRLLGGSYQQRNIQQSFDDQPSYFSGVSRHARQQNSRLLDQKKQAMPSLTNSFNLEQSRWYRAENNFYYPLLFSACMLSLAHGSNDVANTASPFALIFTQFKDNILKTENQEKYLIDGKWATIGGIICSFGLILGIIILGTRVLQTLGKGIVSLKMSSGFAAQLGSAIVTIIGTYFGVPLSTTNLIVMSIIGIGVIDNAYPDVTAHHSGSSSSNPIQNHHMKNPIIEEEQDMTSSNQRKPMLEKKRVGSWTGKYGKKRRHEIAKILIWWIVTMIVGGISSFGLRKILWLVVLKNELPYNVKVQCSSE